MIEPSSMSLETILVDIHGNGLLNIVLLFTCAITSFISALELQTVIFMNYTPDFKCVDRLINISSAKWISESTYRELLDRNLENPLAYSNGGEHTQHQQECWAVVNRSMTESFLFQCQHWKYEESQMKRTVVTQFDLVCGKKGWIPWIAFAYLISIAIGYLLSTTSDKFGRKKLLLLFAVWEIAICLITPFSVSPTMLLILRCLRGISNTMSYLGITLISEISPVHLRALYGNMYWLLWSFGYTTAAGLAYFTRDWIYLRLWMCAFFVTYLLFPFIVLESPRWLCSRGRTMDALRIFKRIAYWNSAKIPKNYFVLVDAFLQVNCESKKAGQKTNDATEKVANGAKEKLSQNDRFIDMFTSPNLRNRTLIFCLSQGSLAIVYFGLAINSTFASKNIFLNVFLMGLIEMPSSAMGWLASTKLGRRTSMVLLFSLTGIAVLTVPFLSLLQPIAQTIVAVLGKLAITIAYLIQFVYIAECYPTSIRSSCFFCIVTVANFTSTIAPFINQLSDVAYYIPAILYTILCVVSAATIHFILPETRNCPLAQIIRESEKLTKGNEKAWIMEMSSVS